MGAATEIDPLMRVPVTIGRKVRAMRTILGISQQELATQARVSQGAISRMESGECEAMPLHTFLAVGVALVQQLGPMREDCTAEVRQVIGVVTGALPFVTNDHQGFSLFNDPGLGALIHAYRQLSELERGTLLRCVVPIAQLIEAKR